MDAQRGFSESRAACAARVRGEARGYRGRGRVGWGKSQTGLAARSGLQAPVRFGHPEFVKKDWLELKFHLVLDPVASTLQDGKSHTAHPMFKVLALNRP